jgi:hypothetical protein
MSVLELGFCSLVPAVRNCGTHKPAGPCQKKITVASKQKISRRIWSQLPMDSCLETKLERTQKINKNENNRSNRMTLLDSGSLTERRGGDRYLIPPMSIQTPPTDLRRQTNDNSHLRESRHECFSKSGQSEREIK